MAESNEMGDKKSNAKGAYPHLIQKGLKWVATVLLIGCSITVIQEGRTQLSVSGGTVCYSKLWLLGTHKRVLRSVSVSKVKEFDMSLGHRLPKTGLCEDLVVKLTDGSEFYREAEGKCYNPKLVEQLNAAARGERECIIEHYSDLSVCLSFALVLVSAWLSCVMFGKQQQIMELFRRILNAKADER